VLSVRKLVAAFGILFAVAACRRAAPDREIPMAPSHAESAGAPSAPASAAATGSGPVRVAGIAFSPAAEWRRVAPESSMRVAQFEIPGASGEKDGTVAVYYFGSGQGGGVAENVQRWQGQFTSPTGPGSATPVERNGLKVTVVTAQGTYGSGMPMGPATPEPGYALWGAIIEAPQGNVFVKATGPKALIDRAHPQFESLLASLQTSTTM
jgi:hypothetical protein